jgi:acyl carrier protein
MPKPEIRIGGYFGFGNSDFIRISDFGLRISRRQPAPACCKWFVDGYSFPKSGPRGPVNSLTRQVEQAMAEDIEQKVIEIVSEQMGVDKSEITRETHFINDLNADSLDTVELVMEFEDEFELSIPDEEAEKIQTVGQAIDYIKEHSGK